MKKVRKIFFCFILLLAISLAACMKEVPVYDMKIEKPLPLRCVNAVVELEDIRGVWIASVENIDFPSSSGLGVDALKAELDSIVNVCRGAMLNAIFFQVRPTSDALYRSSLFPLSTYLTGGQQRMATDSDFDPLEYLVDIAHKNGIAVHAWINPMRITRGTVTSPRHDLSVLSPLNPACLHPEYVVRSSDGCMYYNVGLPEVRRLIALGVSEIVKNYAVDGVVFDDYFYPYPGGTSAVTFDDGEAYAAYGDGRSLADFRRACVNDMVKLCYETVKSERRETLFGISPFGIWQNQKDDPAGSATNGLNAYNAIFCDAIDWAKGGYVDYIAPQLYWTSANTVASYDVLCLWWSQKLSEYGRGFIVCHAAYRYDDWQEPEGEMTQQMSYASAMMNYRGSVFYGYDEIRRNSHGITDEISAAFSK